MPHALTTRQKEYLEYIKKYIENNESSPSLEEIAKHFGVKPPSAHKMLKALQSKGFILFRRDPVSGFFIRVFERVGTPERIGEINILGRVDKYGEIHELGKPRGHFPMVLIGSDEMACFALEMHQHMSKENLMANDILVFDFEKSPQPGDIGILLFGTRFFLVRYMSKTYDKDTPQFELAQQYPIPKKLVNWELEQQLNWLPLAWDESTDDFFLEVVTTEGMPTMAVPPNINIATALNLIRTLSI